LYDFSALPIMATGCNRDASPADNVSEDHGAGHDRRATSVPEDLLGVARSGGAELGEFVDLADVAARGYYGAAGLADLPASSGVGGYAAATAERPDLVGVLADFLVPARAPGGGAPAGSGN